MKMNKNGWGLGTELIIILLLVVFLIYVIFGLNKMGLIRNMNEALGTDIKPSLVIEGKTKNYELIEEHIINVSKNYVKDQLNNNIDDSVNIRISTLIQKGYLSIIRDTNDKQCTGYVTVNSSLKYKTYLNCDNYTSRGYEAQYDW